MRLVQLELLKDKSLLSLDEIKKFREIIPTQTKQVFILGEIKTKNLLFLCCQPNKEQYTYIIFDRIIQKIISGPSFFPIELQRLDRVNTHYTNIRSIMERLASRYDFPEIPQEELDYYYDNPANSILSVFHNFISISNKMVHKHHIAYYVKLIELILGLFFIHCDNSDCELLNGRLDYHINEKFIDPCSEKGDNKLDTCFLVNFRCASCGSKKDLYLKVNDKNPKLSVLYPPSIKREKL